MLAAASCQERAEIESREGLPLAAISCQESAEMGEGDEGGGV